MATELDRPVENELDLLVLLIGQITGDEPISRYGELREQHDVVSDGLREGKTIGVYENTDLGSPTVGHLKVAAFEGEVPNRLPDTEDEKNYRYYLKTTYARE